MTDAVLLTCHGSIERIEDLAAFLTSIRRGRPAPEDLLREMTHRYERIGGSPLMRESRAQAHALEAKLGIPVRVAGRLWGPYPEEVLAELTSLGATRVLSLPLAPQSVHVYHESVREAAAALPSLDLVEAPPWGAEPSLIDAFVETIDEGLSALGDAPSGELAVILSAHSLPMRVIASGDPYEAQFREMAGLVAAPLTKRGHPVEIAFQSQGATADPWLGPDLPTAFASLASRGVRRALVAPIGFVAEHVETLYDLDVEAPGLARAAGIERFARAAAVGHRSRFVDALAAVALRALANRSPGAEVALS